MQEHLQQTSTMEQTMQVSLKAGAKGLSGRKYKMKGSVSSLTGQNCDLSAVGSQRHPATLQIPPAKPVCPALQSAASFPQFARICVILMHFYGLPNHWNREKSPETVLMGAT